jgi:hypothetical protein
MRRRAAPGEWVHQQPQAAAQAAILTAVPLTETIIIPLFSPSTS